MPLPNEESRKDILKIHTRRMNLDEEHDFDILSSSTDGMSGADLKAVCTEAGIFAIRGKRRKVSQDDFTKSIGKMKNIN